MIFLILTISFNLLSTGNLQELSDDNDFKLPQLNLDNRPILSDPWPVQTIQTVQGNFFGQAFRNINSKPCSGRRNLQNSNEQWIPTFSSKIIKPINNFDNSILNPQAINDENDVPIAMPIIEENDPVTVLNDDKNHLFKSRNSLSLHDLVEDKLEDATEVQNELEIEDRSGTEPTASEKDALSLVNYDKEVVENYNVDDKLSDNLENDVDENKLEEKEPESGSLVEIDKLPVECINKKKEIAKENIIGQSRRSMSKFKKESNLNIAEINDKADTEQNKKISDNGNNFEKQLNDDNKNLLSTNEGSKNKNVSNNRKAMPAKLLTRGKQSLQDSNNDLLEPTKGSGVTELSESRMMLMDYSRLCYACSTASNPRCWAPDRKTTVKYCRKGHEVCVTKTFQIGNTLTLVRDCGKSCDDVDVPGLVPKYKTCSICHSDLCNSAYTINNHNLIFAFLLITAIKCIY